MAPQTFPERRPACCVGHATHFGDDLVAEQLRELGDEQHPRLGQQPAIEAVAVIGVQEQRTQLGIAGQVVGQEQRRDLAVDVQLLRSADRQPHAIVVPGLAQTDITGDGGNPHHLALVVFEYEQVVRVPRSASPRKVFSAQPTRCARRSSLAGNVVRPAPVLRASSISAGRSLLRTGRTIMLSPQPGLPREPAKLAKPATRFLNSQAVQTATMRTLAPSPTPSASAASILSTTGLPGAQSSSSNTAR